MSKIEELRNRIVEISMNQCTARSFIDIDDLKDLCVCIEILERCLRIEKELEKK